jgi:hypothetical protein
MSDSNLNHVTTRQFWAGMGILCALLVAVILLLGPFRLGPQKILSELKEVCGEVGVLSNPPSGHTIILVRGGSMTAFAKSGDWLPTWDPKNVERSYCLNIDSSKNYRVWFASIADPTEPPNWAYKELAADSIVDTIGGNSLDGLRFTFKKTICGSLKNGASIEITTVSYSNDNSTNVGKLYPTRLPVSNGDNRRFLDAANDWPTVCPDEDYCERLSQVALDKTPIQNWNCTDGECTMIIARK